jgi:4-alpha-glucanotransferase
MPFERNAGILLHPTSLPGKFGIGDLGSEAFNFINFLEHSGQKLWQVLPLGPTGYGDSPYQCFSAFAGNPLLISPEKLYEDGFLAKEEIDNAPESNPHKVDFGKIINYKKELFLKAFNAFRINPNGLKEEFENFSGEQSDWLEDYSFFMALKDFHSGAPWNKWEKSLVERKQKVMKEWREKLYDQMLYQKFIQFIFFKQWKEVKNYANEKGIKMIGDVPIFIAYDSADLWANKELFTVDKSGKLGSVAGVPPDYFSETGQLWGNPLYKWDLMEKNDFEWWRKRLSTLLEFIDIIRIDHFRGFDAYWEIPGDAPNAITGKWVKAPGEKLFNSLKKHFGELPILAEDLGVITKSVEALRDRFDFPGMKILQFAFGTGMEDKFLPHNYISNCCVYTGSHDNDTTRAYFEKAKEQDNDIFEHARKYLAYDGNNFTAELIRTAYSSVANTVLIPMQDILNLGGEARMNFPSKLGGNWSWRFTWDQVKPELADYYKYLSELYERPPKDKIETEIDVQ